MTVEEQLAAALAEVENLRMAIAEKDCIIQDLRNKLLWLRKKVFGQMSEKALPVDPSQLSLFEEKHLTDEERARLDREVEEAEKTITRTIAVKARPSRRPLDITGLRRRSSISIRRGSDGNGHLRAEYVEIGTDESSRLEKRPAEVYIHKDVFHKVILKSDIETKHPEDREILSPERPLVPVARCMAGASVLTDIIVGKFVYHLPFYRLIQQYRESGITISDSTMGGWYEAAVEKLKLLYDILRRQILSSEYIQIDESVIPVIDNEKHKARKGYEWCVRDAVTGCHVHIGGSRGYHVAGKSGRIPGKRTMRGYEAYDQFEKMPGITVRCWAHVRRKFVDSLKENERLALEGILFIRKLYKVESDADDKGLSAEERMEQRRRYPSRNPDVRSG
ncbi:IS66 family transposase [Phocaeicola coprocola]|uniref:IS66 family transposase n=1 Tax=Phocaeicola coprocola TaxID=310298 RepID=UPI0039915F7C